MGFLLFYGIKISPIIKKKGGITMFIDLKNGSCINASEVLSVTFVKQSGSYNINIKFKPHNSLKKESIEINFDEALKANEYIKKYFNIETYFD